MIRQWWHAGSLAAVLLAAPAFAQRGEAKRGDAANPGDAGLSVRSGVTAFTGNLGAETDVGAFVGVQAEVRPLRLLAVELGYEGSANGFEDTSAGTLWRHNVGALAKVGPIVDNRWQPFVGAGVGGSYLDPTGDSDEAFDSDFIVEVPLAAGLEYRFSSLTAGVRATYRFLDDEDFAPGDVDQGDLFTAGLSLGGRF